ncbi:MAG: CBS domain-containing protein [Candidatus Dadabacteria bacterium]|jgi:predicted transcriptional regulator|nr:CBS domain-containing protein [Candidatus Dadabacteria bacterium]MCZ6555736.1 CBS domain-containing protein [Candidatus Dadabacteria bacterium]MCZ6639397.1 CBS domain-containing protein [Candidatus Dadabacteria bacterium]MCZ6864151.1 CBS domain-containing protein [Candidatus Dadabacteria bacterium]
MLEELKVRDLIGARDKVFFVGANDTANVAALKLRNFKVRTTGVMNDGKVVGVVGHSDFSTKVVALGKKPTEVKVSEIMSTTLQTVSLDTSILACMDLMNDHGISHLFILDDDGQYYGMVAWSDLQRKLVSELKYQLKMAQEYAFGPL